MNMGGLILVILVTLSIVLANCHEMHDLKFVPHECIKVNKVAINEIIKNFTLK